MANMALVGENGTFYSPIYYEALVTGEIVRKCDRVFITMLAGVKLV